MTHAAYSLWRTRRARAKGTAYRQSCCAPGLCVILLISITRAHPRSYKRAILTTCSASGTYQVHGGAVGSGSAKRCIRSKANKRDARGGLSYLTEQEPTRYSPTCPDDRRRSHRATARSLVGALVGHRSKCAIRRERYRRVSRTKTELQLAPTIWLHRCYSRPARGNFIARRLAMTATLATRDVGARGSVVRDSRSENALTSRSTCR